MECSDRKKIAATVHHGPYKTEPTYNVRHSFLNLTVKTLKSCRLVTEVTDKGKLGPFYGPWCICC